jgi:hypothetical protein
VKWTPPDQNIPPVRRVPPLKRRTLASPVSADDVPTICDFGGLLVTHLYNRRLWVHALGQAASDRWGSRYRAFWTERLKELAEFAPRNGVLGKSVGGILRATDILGPLASGFNEVSEHKDAAWYAKAWHFGAAAGLDVAMGLQKATVMGRQIGVGGGARIAAIDSLVGLILPGASPSETIKSSLDAAPGIVIGSVQAVVGSDPKIATSFHQGSLDGQYGPVFRAASGLGDAIQGDYRGVTKFDAAVYDGKYGAALSLVSSSTRGFDGLAHFDELSRNGGVGWFPGKCNETGQIFADVVYKPKMLGNLLFGW